MTRKKLTKKFNWFNFALFFLASIAGVFVLQKSIIGTTCANTGSCKESLSLKVENGAVGKFNGQKVTPPQIDLAKKETPTKVLGEATLTGEKHIYVDLTTQTLSAYQGDTLFLQTLISSGKSFPTPTGEFTIWEMLRATRMSGGSGAFAYDLPNVPYVMFYSGSGIAAAQGFSLHGTYWHNNFGHPMSHGCVNMRTIDAEKIFYWAEVGTKITVYGQAP
ncbi:MAG: L,D-transpeptidase [Candidatus Woesebacteria bacterium]|nr:MAG: L,D-transpeptidase [Candidatus Woesebacteria bacterium]